MSGRTRRLTLALALTASLAFSGAVAAAQETICPAAATCYAGHELEFDIADGPIQFLVVETTVETTTTLDGQTTSETATLVEFRSNGDMFVLTGDAATYPKIGVLVTADVGDTFGVIELGGDQ